MIERTIKKLKSFSIFDEIIVSTDSEAIKDISKSNGAIVPFLRCPKLSGDHVSTIQVIADMIKQYDEKKTKAKHYCCIYPCTPFLLKEDLIGALNLLSKTQSKFSFPVTNYPHPVQRRFKKTHDGKLTFIEPEFEMSRTQDLEEFYHDAGQFYWGSSEAWLNQNQLHSNGVGYFIPRTRAIDIDTDDDWLLAEILFEAHPKYLELK